jgi:hypothetical protein
MQSVMNEGGGQGRPPGMPGATGSHLCGAPTRAETEALVTAISTDKAIGNDPLPHGDAPPPTAVELGKRRRAW